MIRKEFTPIDRSILIAAADAPRRTRLGAALGIVLALCGCRRDPMRPTVVFGRDFPCRSAIGIEGEPSADEVVTLIGDPLERTPVAGGEVFRYSVRGRYGDRVRLLGLIRISEPHYAWSCDVRLEFRGGHLYSITHSRANEGPDGEEKEGPTTRILAPPPGR